MRPGARGALFLFIVFVVVICAGFYFSLDFLVDVGSRRILSCLAASGPGYGIELENLDFQSVETSFFKIVNWRNITASGTLKKNAFFKPDQDIYLSIEKVTLRPNLFGSYPFYLTAHGIDVGPDPASPTPDDLSTPSLKRIQGETFETWFNIAVLKPKKAARQIKSILGELRGLLEQGRCSVPVFFSGYAVFPVGNKPVTARISIIQDKQESVLVMNELDLIRLSSEFGLEKPLTEAEVGVLSRNPLKVPRLFELRNDARAASREARREDRSIPEDAYRHVLWSYLLTRSYGPDFAKQVTDAHEQGRTGNTNEERLMDINNNTVGRNYALSGAPESLVLARMMADSDVIRSPGETKRKSILR